MSAERNKALVRRFFETQEEVGRGKADVDALDQMLAPGLVAHTKLLPGQQPDREGYKQAVAELSATSSNARFLIEEQVAQGDKVWTRLIVRSTHDRREIMGVAPTGREMSFKFSQSWRDGRSPPTISPLGR